MQPNEILEKIQALWPKWKPTEAETVEWRSALHQLANDHAMGKAISLLYQTSRFLPKLSELIGAYRNQFQATAASGSGGQPSFSGYAVICTAHPTVPAKAGQFQALHRDASGQPAGSDHCLSIAQRWQAKAEHMHGGTWEILAGWSLDQVMDESQRIKHGSSVEDWPAERELIVDGIKLRRIAASAPVDMTGLRSRFGVRAEQAPAAVGGAVAGVMAKIE